MALGIGSIFGLGSAALGVGFGAVQKIQARNLEKKNKLPFATVNANIAKNAAIANNMANVGIASQQYNNARTQQDQNLANVLNVASRSGKNIPLAGILRQSDLASQNLNAQDQAARLGNQKFAIQQNGVLANEEQRVWNWNFAQPYLRTAQQVASLRNAGNQNIFGGLSSATQMAIGGAFDGSKGGQTGNGGFFGAMGAYGTPNYGFNGVVS